MDWMLSLVFLFSVPQPTLFFNVDPNAWKSFSNPATAFGYKVIQTKMNSLLVSAPLMRYDEVNTGKVYECEVGTTRCSDINIKVPGHGKNMSLGLSMTKDTKSSRTVVCGPTISRACDSITTYNGMCFQLNEGLAVIGDGQPKSLRDCPVVVTDIVFLLDGSGSVTRGQFEQMKTFVKTLIAQFLGRNSQFAVMQYSSAFKIHFDFNAFRMNRNNWQNLIDNIAQIGGWTHTPTAIRKVVNELFIPTSGSRLNANKVLLVITDGITYGDNTPMKTVTDEAEKKGIIRYAIGVGNAFTDPNALKELETIASKPIENHRFRVDSFEALDKLRDTLQKSIFAIEGTQTGESFAMELAQEGFSSSFLDTENILMGTVGAFDWKGGYQEMLNRQTFHTINSMESNSYLGYSMAIAETKVNKKHVILGAPRYKHEGIVIISFVDGRQRKLNSHQIGSYFGAEVCTVDLDLDMETDLLLISAPMYNNRDRDSEGEVTVCRFNSLLLNGNCDGMPLVGVGGMRGRFGASLAALSDLNGDGISELAVGAPLENNGQGSLYIFSGVKGGVNSAFSQRIQGSVVQPGLQYFGQSISGSLDQSGDALVDIAVGSKGIVMLFRSRPVVSMDVKLSFSPPKIPTDNTDCNAYLTNTATVCFSVRRLTTDTTDLKAEVNYTLTLDATRSRSVRASFGSKERSLKTVVTIKMGKNNCYQHEFQIPACPEDALNPLFNELKFSFNGLPSSSQLSPILNPSSQNTTYYPLDFVIDCGADKKCIDDLKVDFNFSGASEVQVGIALVLNVTVAVENRGENSYNTRVLFTYPVGLSYRRVSLAQGSSSQATVQCNASDSVDATTLGRSHCYINKPILRTKAQVFFVISFGIDGNSHFEKSVTFTANATSGNEEHYLGENSKMKSIDVKYGIYTVVKSFEDSTSYINFTAGVIDLKRRVLHSFQVINYLRDLNVTVTIKVPIKLGDKDIWTKNDRIQIPGCRKEMDEAPVTNFVEKLKKNPAVDCSVSVCRVLKCSVHLKKDDQYFFNVSGEVSSGWIKQTKLTSLRLVSSSVLDYDRNQFIFSSNSENISTRTEAITQVEVYTEAKFTKEIIGGVVGGLLLIALVTAGLYKAGFFKSKYNQMIQEAGGEADEGAGETVDSSPATE